jgi:hypothetical protein
VKELDGCLNLGVTDGELGSLEDVGIYLALQIGGAEWQNLAARGVSGGLDYRPRSASIAVFNSHSDMPTTSELTKKVGIISTRTSITVRKDSHGK